MAEKKEIYGNEALNKCEQLTKVNVDSRNWITEYRDDVTGEKWILDYPDAHVHGGGVPRLRSVE